MKIYNISWLAFELQRPVNENREKVLGELLFGYGIMNEVGIYNMWKLRNKMLGEINKQNNYSNAN